MRLNFTLLTAALLSFGAMASSAKGEFIRQAESDYEITDTMVKQMEKDGTSYYSVNLMDHAEFMKSERKAFLELDYMGQNKLKNNSYLVSKHTYMIDRPAEFFTCELLNNIKYVRALEKETVTRRGEMKYILKGEKFMVYKYQFDLNWFADLPDCQNMAKDGSAEMQDGLAKLKSYDHSVSYPLHGAYLKDKPNFTKFLTSGWIFAKMHSVGKKTLMISYEVSAMPSEYAIKNIVENGHIQVMTLEEKANKGF